MRHHYAPDGGRGDMQQKLAILVGGGPAPGINSVIGAATIRGALEGVEVLGIRDGFEWIMQGDIDHVTPLDIDDVSRIHFRGGSHIGISRANPTARPRAPRERGASRCCGSNVDMLHHDRRRRHRVLGHEARAEGARAASAWCTCPRRSTTTSTCPPTSTPSASRPRATSASTS